MNNVGIGSDGTVVTSEVDAWQRVMDVNLTSMVLASPASAATGSVSHHWLRAIPPGQRELGPGAAR